MKHSLRLVAVLLLIFSSSAFAQYNFYDFDFLGGGARAQGMGKAFYSVSDDITAGTWNPAGLIGTDKPVLGISWSTLSPTGKSNVTILNTHTSEHSGSFGDITSINFIAPIRIKGHPFALSANFNRNFAAFQQFDVSLSDRLDFLYFRSDVGLLVDTVDFDVMQKVGIEGGVHVLNVGFGTRIYNNLAFGFTANIYTGNTLSQNHTDINFHDLRYYDLVQFGDQNTTSSVIDTNKFEGLNFTIGFKYSKEKLNLAAVIKTPYELKVNRERAVFQITKFNDLIEDNGTDTTFFNDLLIKYEMPLMLGIGASYKVNEKLLVSGDLEYRSFSGKKVFDRVGITINPSGDNEEEFLEIDPEWKNVFTVRMGAEYLKEQSFGIIPLRAGFSVVPLPDQDIDLAGTTSQPVQYNLSFGTGIHWEQIHFDFAYTYETKDRNYVTLVNDGQLGDMSVVTALEDRNHHITVSFTGVF